jgi:hypothetical protein
MGALAICAGLVARDAGSAVSITVLRLPLPAGHSPVERVISTVGRVDLALVEALHAGRAVRPYACVPRGAMLDVVSCDDALTRALLAGEPAARLVTRLRPADLIAPGCRGHQLRIAFVAPTAFRVAGLDHALPDPLALWQSLRRRWEALGWPALPVTPDLSRVAAAPEGLVWQAAAGPPGGPITGCVGVVRYTLLALAPEQRAALWTLARFGEFRGAGRATGYGLGRLRLLAPGERWRPGDPATSAWEPPRLDSCRIPRPPPRQRPYDDV